MRPHACPACGSRDLRPPSVADGAIPGATELTFMVCEACGERGQPLEFEDKEAYQAFLGAPKPRPPEPAPSLRETGPPDWLDRWTSRKVVSRLIGLSFAVSGVLIVAVALLALVGGALLGAVPPPGSLLFVAVFAAISLGLAYLFLRHDPEDERPAHSRRRRAGQKALSAVWVPPLLVLFGAYIIFSIARDGLPADLDAARLGLGAVGALPGVLWGVAFVLMGVRGWRENRVRA